MKSSIILLSVIVLFFTNWLYAQNPSSSIPQKPATKDVKDPILVVTGKDNGVVDEWNMWFKGNGTSVYRLCTHRDEPIWGATPPYGQESMSSEELFRIRGSVLNLKVWEQLQFYLASLNASVVGSDENSAETYTIGDGLFETVYKSSGGSNTTSDKPPRSSSELPPSAFANAVLTRTASGAKLEIDGIPSARCGEESLNINSTSPIIKINISNAELATWTKLEKTVAAKGPGSDGNGTYAYEVTVTATLPDVGVEIIGCTEIGMGDESVVTAKASKEGGTYRFWAEPQDMFSIKTNGSSATLLGSSPGRGTLYVEYTGTDGKTTESKTEAACINVESYNNGQKIPQIPLFDIDGKKLDGILKISVEIKPNDAAELLSYIPADPGVLTAVGLGDVVTIQGIIPGKTTLQATTNCVSTAGPATEVEVVNCDDETIARLAEMMRLAKEEQKRAAEEIEEILGSEEFEKAANEIAKSTYDMAEKTALLIMSTSGATGAAKTVSDVLSAAAAIKDFVNSDTDMEKTSNGLQILVAQLGSDAQQAVAGVTETMSAAGKFGINLGTLMATNIRLKGAAEVYEQANRQIINISALQNICKKGTNPQQKQEQPTTKSEQPTANPAPATEPAQKSGTSSQKTEAQSAPETEAQQPQDADSGESPPEEEVLVDPELPPIPARQVGLPFNSGDCGCENTQSISTIKEGLTSMQNGMERLNECVDNFSKGPLTDYLTTLNDWTTLTEKLKKSAGVGSVGIESSTKETVPVIESLLVRTKSFDNAGKTFLEEFKACPGSMKSGVEVLNSVNVISVDSLKVKY